MRRIVFYFVCCLSAALFIACGGDPVTPGGKDQIGAITGEASHISCRNAEISGKANLPGTTATDLTFGVLYSTNSGVLLGTATQIQAKSFDSDYNYTVNTEVLEPETTYYYRSYISQNNEITYGDTKSFTTLPVSSMIQALDASNISMHSATLNAIYDLTNCNYVSVEFGFKLSHFGGDETIRPVSSFYDNAFSLAVESLIAGQQYEVNAYVILDGRAYYSDKRGFTTNDYAVLAVGDTTIVTSFGSSILGTINVESEPDITYSAVLYYQEAGGSPEELKTYGTPAPIKPNDDSTFHRYVGGLKPDQIYHYVIAVTIDNKDYFSEVKQFTTRSFSIPVAIDMGLSIKWGSFNMGANKPEEYGDYYSWGETSSKLSYDWSTYTLSNGSSKTITKYGPVDNKTTLEKVDDVASQKLGENWRIPTSEEWEELLDTDNCSWTLSEANGVNGYIVISKKTGNSIFLPFSGQVYQEKLRSNNLWGDYWSSSLESTSYHWNAKDVYIHKTGAERTTYDRIFGNSVRPVCD